MEAEMNIRYEAGARRATGPEGQFLPDSNVIVRLASNRSIQGFGAGAGLLILLALVAVPRPGSGQEKKKVPVLDKITSVPEGQNEFNGKVQSLDLKNEVLNLQSLHEDDTEIFPIKKSVTVATANGYRVDISALKPGTNVLVYFEQRGDKRKVKEIVILGEAPAAGAKTPAAPPS
jgi:hypothetical protein